MHLLILHHDKVLNFLCKLLETIYEVLRLVRTLNLLKLW